MAKAAARFTTPQLIDAIRKRRVLQEAYKRSAASHDRQYRDVAAQLAAGLHPVQRAAFDDPAIQRAFQCSRRSGKSWLTKIELLCAALTIPDSYSVYVNRSQAECRRIMWGGKAGLLALCKRAGLKPTNVNQTRLTITFANGSTVQLIGADDAEEIEKLRGAAYDLVVVDEAQKFPRLKHFWEDIISPALGDAQGRVILTGTPSTLLAGFFYEVTKEGSEHTGWSVHRWHYRDNLALGHLTEYNAKIKKANGWTDDHPTWLTEYENRWVGADNLRVYRFNDVPEEDRYYAVHDDHADGRPHLPYWTDAAGARQEYDWEFALGVDLGWYPDPFAYVVWAFCQNYPCAYEIDSYKEIRLNTDQQAELIQRLMAQYDFTLMVMDATGQGANIHDAWVKRGIPIKKAEKTSGAYSKRDYIELLNGALLSHYELPPESAGHSGSTLGRVKYRQGSPLSEELAVLQWNERTLKTLRPVEDKDHSQNDAADAALYCWKEMHNHAWEPLAQAAQPGSKEYWAEVTAEYERQGQPRSLDDLFDAGRYEFYQPLDLSDLNLERDPLNEDYQATV